ncbi:MAG TPA: GAF domain-containing sensor histidine kinase [Thermomicrobiales bacterium]|nr:GAF domain-containing sensor histidine kinase [Thermomicrobiales bacterium]
MFKVVAPRWLNWIMVVVPLMALMALDLVRRVLFPEFFDSWAGFLTLFLILLVGIAIFARFIVAEIESSHQMLRQQNDELLALHHASLAIESELDLQRVLQRIVEEARQLLGVKYGGLTFFRENGELEAFITSGMPEDSDRVLGPPPHDHGVIGSVTASGATARLRDVSEHPESKGFPEGHPIMGPLLAVPIHSKTGVFGNLYLADDVGKHFDARDEETLIRFAALSAVAIENARLHQQVRALAITEERERIAREMHDSLAQVLGYVNTKVQAAKVLVNSGQTEKALEQLDQMANASRSAYADVREGILSLRTSLEPHQTLVETLSEYLPVWEEQSGVRATLDADGVHDGSLSDLAEVQLLRIIQEALTNVRKHAQASRVSVTMTRADGVVVTVIADNGRGFDPKDRGSRGVPQFGMSTMRERVESLGGSLEITSVAGEGTTVRVSLPAERTL